MIDNSSRSRIRNGYGYGYGIDPSIGRKRANPLATVVSIMDKKNDKHFEEVAMVHCSGLWGQVFVQ
jgi:hypothetical protein